MKEKMMTDGLIVFGLGAQTKYVLECFAVTGRYRAEAVMMLEGTVPHMDSMMDVPIRAWDEEQIGRWRDQGIRNAFVVHSNTRKKARFMGMIRALGFDLVNAIHPRACIATTARLGTNVIVNPNSTIQPFTVIGDGVMIHAGTILEHDNQIGDYANLAPGVALAGWVTVGEGTTIYTNATVIPTRKIGKHAIVAAGAVVLDDVPDFAMVAGNPAKLKKYLQAPS